MNQHRKRLQRHAKAISLFHGTTWNRLKTILQTGIAAGIDESTWANTTKTLTFFTSNMANALMYAQYSWVNDDNSADNLWVVLTVNLDTEILMPDIDDCNWCTTWQASLENIEQVAVNGSVPASRITDVMIYAPFVSEMLYEGTPADILGNWDDIAVIYKTQVDAKTINQRMLTDMENSISEISFVLGSIVNIFTVVNTDTDTLITEVLQLEDKEAIENTWYNFINKISRYRSNIRTYLTNVKGEIDLLNRFYGVNIVTPVVYYPIVAVSIDIPNTNNSYHGIGFEFCGLKLSMGDDVNTLTSYDNTNAWIDIIETTILGELGS